ncbi:MAG: NAD(P)-dependent oxidoreductase [Candidatus Njordarchaeales archaeon]
MKAFITAPFYSSALKLLEENDIKVSYHPWIRSKRILGEKELIEILNKDSCDILVVELEYVSDKIIDNTALRIIGICRNDPSKNIDIEAANRKGVYVLYTPGRNANAVAELTIALMLAVLRKIIRADRLLRSGKIVIDSFEKFAEFYESLRGAELSGKTVGIIGLGKIGYRVAKKLRGFGVKLLVYDPYVSDEKIRCVRARRVSLEELLQESDIVTIHVPPTEETIDMIGEEELKKMKNNAILINTASSVVVDEDALFRALKEGWIAGAGLDVSAEEPIDSTNRFLQLDNVVLTPHIGGASYETIKIHSYMIAYDIIRILKGEKPKFLYNKEALKT